MPLETKHTIHIFWSPWKISANTFIAAKKESNHREAKICFGGFFLRDFPLLQTVNFILFFFVCKLTS